MTREELGKLINEAGLAEQREAMLDLAAPAIAVTAMPADPATLDPHGSFCGGPVLLPEGSAWPTHEGRTLWPLAQIALADVAHLPAAADLPDDGWLVFFYDLEGEDDDMGGTGTGYSYHGHVLHVTEPSASLRALPEGRRPMNFPRPAALSFQPALTLPDMPDDDETLLPTEEACDRYYDLQDAVGQMQATRHQLLGHAAPVQGDPRYECISFARGQDFDGIVNVTEAEAESWRLLFQLDSSDDLNIMWGDAGTLYYCLPAAALAAGDFRQAQPVWQCY